MWLSMFAEAATGLICEDCNVAWLVLLVLARIIIDATTTTPEAAYTLSPRQGISSWLGGSLMLAALFPRYT